MRKATLLMLLSVAPVLANWSDVQANSLFNGGSCVNSQTTCSITITATGGGNTLVALFFYGVTGATATSVNLDNGSGGSAQAFTHGCGPIATGSNSMDIWYLNNINSGLVRITASLSAAASRGVIFYEKKPGTGKVGALDAGSSPCATTTSTFTGTSVTGQVLTISGSTDFIIQGVQCAGSTVSSIGSSYTVLSTGGVRDAAFLDNTASGAAPTWTVTSGTSEGYVVGALAISETSSAAATMPPVIYP